MRTELSRADTVSFKSRMPDTSITRLSGISSRTPEELREWVKQRAEAALENDLANNKLRRVRS